MNLVVIGAQWGDEGKGKIVDYLAGDAENVIRFSGGANAGHTIVIGDVKYKLHLVPSGVIYPGKAVILGTGMVIDLESLFTELDTISEQGVDWKGRVFISDRAHIVLPEYKQIDIDTDKARKRPLGTTGRGIGVTYSMKSQRDGVRVADIYDDYMFDNLSDEAKEFLTPYKEKIKDMVLNTAYYMEENKDKHNLFEGAQGVLLDIDNGTYPFVSSGMSCATGAAAGSGVGPKAIDKILGVFKAYTTRVGNGPFPSEFTEERDGDLEEQVREIGGEYGVTTGRARRCGYLDLVALKYACMTNSMDALVLTHLDVYDTMTEVKACVAYEIDGEEVKEFPASCTKLGKAKPVTKTFKGWNTDLSGVTSFEELPKEAQEYIQFIEEYVGTPIEIISVGAERKQTFMRKDAWKK